MAMSFFSGLSALGSVSDEQAMWRVKMQDDGEAFALLVRRWEQPIQRLCTRMTGDPHRGEDLAQETFARLFARRKTYEPAGRLSTFLWQVALNLCYDELRKIHRRGECFLEDHACDHRTDLEHLVALEAAPDAHAVQQERAATVRQALLELEEPYRVVVVLRHYEGLKFREIGEVLGLPEGTVKSRMVEALQRLQRALHPVLRDEPQPLRRNQESLVL